LPKLQDLAIFSYTFRSHSWQPKPLPCYRIAMLAGRSNLAAATWPQSNHHFLQPFGSHGYAGVSAQTAYRLDL
jgi:hypothetical protein